MKTKKPADINVTAIKKVLKELLKQPREKKITNKEYVQNVTDLMREKYSMITIIEWQKLYAWNDKTFLYEEYEPQIKNEIEQELGEEATPAVVNGILFKLKNVTSKRLAEVANADINLIPLKGALWDLKNKKPIMYTDKHIYFSKLNVDCHPELDFPNIKTFEMKVFQGDQKKISLFRKIVAYCFYRRYPIHKGFLFLGEGDNGKSVSLSLIRAMLGEQNVSGRSLQELTGDRFAIVHLHNKYANLDADMSKVTLNAPDMYKKLTGEDLVTGQYKGKDGFEFTNFAKLIFSANEVPDVSEDTSERFFSRWDYLEYEYIIPIAEQNPNILSELTTQQEMDAYAGLLLTQVLPALLEEKKFSDMTDEERKQMWFKHGESSAQFCTDCLTPAVGAVLYHTDLWNAYTKYCTENKLRAETMTKLLRVIRKKFKEAVPRSSTSKPEDNGEKKSVWASRNIRFKVEEEKPLDKKPDVSYHYVED